MSKKLKGFTLVELLVAMAIIGIILGLALFGISAAQRNARDTERKAALQDINAGAADFYTIYSSPISAIEFDTSGAALLYDGGTTPTAADCETTYTGDCLLVPLEGAAKPAPSSGKTDQSQTYYIFNGPPSISDGYQLAACLEGNNVPYDVSTSATKVTSGCPPT